MRFLGYLDGSTRMIGAVTGSGAEVVAVAPVEEFYAAPFARTTVHPSGRSRPRGELVEVPPVPVTSRIFCLGLNYQSHIDEIELPGRARPEAPNVFGRWFDTLVCDGAEVPVPPGEPGLDWEGELAVVVGAELADVGPAEAMAGVLGYTAFNDISARTYQRAASQFTLGKNADRSGPIGPVVVTADEYGDPYGRRLETRYDGQTVQSGTTDAMIFRIDETLAYISRVLTLRPGDVLATGTPDGVGIGRDPVVLMRPGDRVEVEIEGIGVLRTRIVG